MERIIHDYEETQHWLDEHVDQRRASNKTVAKKALRYNLFNCMVEIAPQSSHSYH
jgi:hypothetical protein